MDKLIKNIVIKPDETKHVITEEDDENKEQESLDEKNKTLNSKQDEDLLENRKKSSSFIVNVNLNENDNSSNLNVKININDTSSKEEISNINSPQYRNSTEEAIKIESKRDSKFSKLSKEPVLLSPLLLLASLKGNELKEFFLFNSSKLLNRLYFFDIFLSNDLKLIFLLEKPL